MKQEYFIYEMTPIDLWDGWIPEEYAIAEPLKFGLADYDDESGLDEKLVSEHARKRLIKKIEYVKELLKKYTSWEGDGSFYISAMPFPELLVSKLVFAVKQSNNGTTFVVSPKEYVHMDDYLMKYVSL